MIRSVPNRVVFHIAGWVACLTTGCGFGNPEPSQQITSAAAEVRDGVEVTDRYPSFVESEALFAAPAVAFLNGSAFWIAPRVVLTVAHGIVRIPKGSSVVQRADRWFLTDKTRTRLPAFEADTFPGYQEYVEHFAAHGTFHGEVVPPDLALIYVSEADKSPLRSAEFFPLPKAATNRNYNSRDVFLLGIKNDGNRKGRTLFQSRSAVTLLSSSEVDQYVLTERSDRYSENYYYSEEPDDGSTVTQPGDSGGAVIPTDDDTAIALIVGARIKMKHECGEKTYNSYVRLNRQPILEWITARVMDHGGVGEIPLHF